MQILMSVMMAVFMFVMVPRAAASGDRICEVLATEPSVTDPAAPAGSVTAAGRVEFDDVEFRYPGAEDPVLSGVSFATGPGETTAIVGGTGSGKSTLINLIPRLYDVTGGTVRIDGVDIREMDRKDLWQRIGFVPQKAFLFSGSVADNLRYGKADASEIELWHALDIAQANQFVLDMPEQLNTEISQGGVSSVSGGQRQRLSIARALIKRASVYVFDDAFSALDFRTDSRLRAALKRETLDATVIIVAQRVSTIMSADRIIVLEDGTHCRHGHARRAHGQLRDVSRDRCLAAHAGGAGVSAHGSSGNGSQSAGAQPGAVQAAGAAQAPGAGGRSRRRGPGGFGGPGHLTAPVEKSKDFRGSMRPAGPAPAAGAQSHRHRHHPRRLQRRLLGGRAQDPRQRD